jgi:hypothetical protein
LVSARRRAMPVMRTHRSTPKLPIFAGDSAIFFKKCNKKKLAATNA